MGADLSQLSNEELMRLKPSAASGVDLSNLSNEDLMKLKAGGNQPSTLAKVGNAVTGALDTFGHYAVDTTMGALKGASDIGATILSPVDKAVDLIKGDRKPTLTGVITGKQPVSRNDERRASMRGFFDENANPDSAGFKVGELGADIAGTAGVGGVLARGVTAAAKVAPAISQYAPKLAAAIESGGFNLGSKPATTLAGRVGDAATRGGAGATVGAASAGLINPDDAATGAVVGGALPPSVRIIAPVAKLAGRTARAAAEPFYEKGQEAIIGRLYNRMAGSPADAAAARTALENARVIVPGSLPTAGQAAGNAGIAGLENTASAIEPTATTAFARRFSDQNAARIGVLNSVAGSDSDMAAAVGERALRTNPLYTAVAKSDAEVDPTRTVGLIDRIISANPKRDALTGPLSKVRESLFDAYPIEQRASDARKELHGIIQASPRMSNADFFALKDARRIMSNVKNGTTDIADAMDAIGNIKATSKTASDVLDRATQYLKTPDYVLSQSPSSLQSASKNIGDLMSTKGPTGAPINESIVRELSIIKKSLDAQITKAEPAYGESQKTFAELSGPVNQMKVGRAISDKSVNKLTGNLQPSAYANALTDQTAAKATGFKRATLEGTMSQENATKLQAIKEDIARAAAATNSGKGIGSDTVKKLAYSNFIDAAGIPTFIRNMASAQVAGNIASRGADALYGRANQEIAAKLAEIGLNPAAVARVMKLTSSNGAPASRLLTANGSPPRLGNAMANPTLRALLYNSANRQANP